MKVAGVDLKSTRTWTIVGGAAALGALAWMFIPRGGGSSGGGGTRVVPVATGMGSGEFVALGASAAASGFGAGADIARSSLDLAGRVTDTLGRATEVSVVQLARVAEQQARGITDIIRAEIEIRAAPPPSGITAPTTPVAPDPEPIRTPAPPVRVEPTPAPAPRRSEIETIRNVDPERVTANPAARLPDPTHAVTFTNVPGAAAPLTFAIPGFTPEQIADLLAGGTGGI